MKRQKIFLKEGEACRVPEVGDILIRKGKQEFAYDVDRETTEGKTLVRSLRNGGETIEETTYLFDKYDFDISGSQSVRPGHTHYSGLNLILRELQNA